MNSRQRVITALGLGIPDRVPWCEAAVDVGLAQKLMEQGSRIPDVGSSSRTENPYDIQSHKALSAGLGLDNVNYLLRAPTYAASRKGKDGRSYVGQGMISSEADLEMIDLPDPNSDELYEEAAEFAANKGDYAACLVTRVGLLQTILSLGIEGFSLALYDNPRLVERMLDIYFDWSAVMAEKVSKLGFDIFWTTDDFAHKTGLMFSPKFFEEMFAPRYRRVAERLSIPWILHSDGDISEAVDLFIDLGVKGFHPLENGAMDVGTFKRNYGAKVCLLGNVDLNILTKGSPEETEAEVISLVNTAGPGGGYILTSGNSLASYLNPDCVMAMGQAVQKHGKYS